MTAGVYAIIAEDDFLLPVGRAVNSRIVVNQAIAYNPSRLKVIIGNDHHCSSYFHSPFDTVAAADIDRLNKITHLVAEQFSDGVPIIGNRSEAFMANTP